MIGGDVTFCSNSGHIINCSCTEYHVLNSCSHSKYIMDTFVADPENDLFVVYDKPPSKDPAPPAAPAK